MQITELIKSIEAAFHSFGPELQRAAAWLIQHPKEAGLHSMRQQAIQAQVSPNTMVRLAQALGYERYIELRSIFQDALTNENDGSHYKGRVKKLQDATPDSHDDGMLRTHIANAQSPVIRNNLHALSQAIKSIRQAKRIYFLGTRSCFAISYHFAYAYSMIAPNGVLVHGLGGTYPDQLDCVDTTDLLVCITQNPYGRHALVAAQMCHTRGVPILALTDSRIAPIQAYATQTLLFDAGTTSYFHSMVGSLALVERLLAKLAAAGDSAMLAHIDTFEQRLRASNAYLPPSTRKKRTARKLPSTQ